MTEAPRPPRPAAAPGRSSLWRLARGFRRDLLSSLPAHLYRAWMAEFRSPLIHSFLCNDPALIRLILTERPGDFPKSNRVRLGLTPLLGNSVFVADGADWARQRRIIDPAFESGRLRQVYPAIWDAAEASVTRLSAGEQDIEPATSHAAADVIFRTLFSLPIEHKIAAQVFAAFRAHQDAQPVVNLAALAGLPRWLPSWHSRRTRATAAQIRSLIAGLVDARLDALRSGTAPDDLATRIMTTPDPVTGRCFDRCEVIDQVAIFFLAGHETSAAALAWSLYLLATHPDWQQQVAVEATELTADVASVAGMRVTRAVFREALRLYPPVPMMVRQATRPEILRDRAVPPGAQMVISLWHLHRHQRLWERPDDFDPARWTTPAGRDSARDAFLPFSAGPRVCPGAGFAMTEGVVLLARIVAAFRLQAGSVPPVPVARLTLRGRDGIRLILQPR